VWPLPGSFLFRSSTHLQSRAASRHAEIVDLIQRAFEQEDDDEKEKESVAGEVPFDEEEEMAVARKRVGAAPSSAFFKPAWLTKI
jgi:hypothetical protein